MTSKTLAFVWESLVVGLRMRILCGGAMLLFPVLLIGFLTPLVDRDDPAMISLYRIMIGVNSVCIAMFAIDEQSRLTHHYCLPVKTSTMVNFRLLMTAIRACFDTMIYIEILNYLFKLNLPLWSPVLFSVTVATVVLATHWACEKSIWQPLILFAPLVPLFLWYVPLSFWFMLRFNASDAYQPERYWLDLMLSITLITAAYFMSRVFVARNRRGDSFDLQFQLPRFLESLFFTRDRTQPFRSPQEAMVWYQWRLFGWVLPCMMVLVDLVVIVILLNVRDKSERWEVLLASGFFLGTMGIAPAIASGLFNSKAKQTELPQFLATRPITNWTMTTPILSVLIKSVLIAWGIWLAPILIFSAIVPVQEIHLKAPQLQWGAPYYLAILLGCWTVAAQYLALLATGRPWISAVVFCAPLAFAIAVDLLTGENTRQQAWNLIHCLLAIGLMAGSGYGFLAARWSDQITPRTILVCLIAWVVICGAAASAIATHHVYEIKAYLLALGMIALVVLPFASLPLALAWNRTR